MKRILEFSIEMDIPCFSTTLKMYKMTQKYTTDEINALLKKTVTIEYDNKALILGVITKTGCFYICHIYVYKEYRRQKVCLNLLKNLVNENNGLVAIACDNVILNIIKKYKLLYWIHTEIINKDGTIDAMSLTCIP